jgi:hypothetical protein
LGRLCEAVPAFFSERLAGAKSAAIIQMNDVPPGPISQDCGDALAAQPLSEAVSSLTGPRRTR